MNWAVYFLVISVLIFSGCTQDQNSTTTTTAEVAKTTTAAKETTNVHVTTLSPSTTVAGQETQIISTTLEVTTTTIPVPDGTFVALKSEVESGKSYEFKYNGKPALLINFAGQYKAYYNKCDHAGGPTELRGEKIVCKWHGSEFEPLTGKKTKGPAMGPLTMIEVLESEDSIYVK